MLSRDLQRCRGQRLFLVLCWDIPDRDRTHFGICLCSLWGWDVRLHHRAFHLCYVWDRGIPDRDGDVRVQPVWGGDISDSGRGRKRLSEFVNYYYYMSFRKSRHIWHWRIC